MDNSEKLKRLFTHSYIIVIFENGKFCWNVKGWVKKHYWSTHNFGESIL